MRVVFGLLTAGLLAAAALPAQAQDWCGFIDKEYSQVRCGFSSRNECKQALGEKKDCLLRARPELRRQRPQRTAGRSPLLGGARDFSVSAALGCRASRARRPPL